MIGWLIEKNIGGNASWLQVYQFPSGMGCRFTTNSEEALRFSRKEDADSLIKILSPDNKYVATEHMWI
jgi:hypothetical protein